MMEEHYLTGYCRVLDSSRIVEIVLENGRIEECGCGYGNCKFQPQCPIAQEIGELTEK